jgi:hypothetical protein
MRTFVAFTGMQVSRQLLRYYRAVWYCWVVPASLAAASAEPQAPYSKRTKTQRIILPPSFDIISQAIAWLSAYHVSAGTSLLSCYQSDSTATASASNVATTRIVRGHPNMDGLLYAWRCTEYGPRIRGTYAYGCQEHKKLQIFRGICTMCSHTWARIAGSRTCTSSKPFKLNPFRSDADQTMAFCISSRALDVYGYTWRISGYLTLAYWVRPAPGSAQTGGLYGSTVHSAI